MTIDPDHIPYAMATRPSGGVPPQPRPQPQPAPPTKPPAACAGTRSPRADDPVPGWLPQVNITNVQQGYSGIHAARRRQSAAAHVFLFLFTAGVGNAWYAWHVSRWNRLRGL